MTEESKVLERLSFVRERLRVAAERIEQGSMKYPGCAYRLDANTVCDFADAIDAAIAALQAQDAQCWCDKVGVGVKGVSCGDCPRDYQAQLPTFTVRPWTMEDAAIICDNVWGIGSVAHPAAAFAALNTIAPEGKAVRNG